MTTREPKIRNPFLMLDHNSANELLRRCEITKVVERKGVSVIMAGFIIVSSSVRAKEKGYRIPICTPFPAGEVLALKRKFGFRCVFCGISERDKGKRCVLDHVVPLSMGGPDSIENLQPLCHLCNAKKRSSSVDYRGNPHELCLQDSGSDEHGLPPIIHFVEFMWAESPRVN